MAHVLKYRVENATASTIQREVEVDGEVGTMSQRKATIEAVPVGHQGSTLALALPLDALADYPEGSEIQITIEAVAPAAANDEEGN